MNLLSFDSSNDLFIDSLHAARNSNPNDILHRLSRPKGESKHELKKIIESRQSSDNFYYFIELDSSDASSQIAGTVQAIWSDQVSRTVEIGILIYKGYQGKGLGKKAILMFLDKLALEFAVRKCFVRILSSNQKSINLFQSIGFKKCGCLTKHFYMNRNYVDVDILEYFTEQQ